MASPKQRNRNNAARTVKTARKQKSVLAIKPKKLMQKRSTVLIVNANQTKTLNVSTRLLKAIKPLLVSLSFATVLLTAGMVYLGYEYQQRAEETSQLEREVKQLKNLTSAEIEAKLSALEASENTVVKLQDYLKAKGVKVAPVDYQTRTDVRAQPDTSETVLGLSSTQASSTTASNSGASHANTTAAGGPLIDAHHAHDNHHHNHHVDAHNTQLSKPIPYVGDFAAQTDALLKKTQTIPLGLPHDGELSSRFGPRRNPFTNRGGEMHGGLDFRGKTGEPIHVTADGTVDFAGVQRGYGKVVIVKHSHGYTTYYAHLSAIDVKKGQVIESGDIIGKLGSTGRSTGPHLHYEVRLNNKRLDPEGFLSIENVAPAT